MLKRMFFVVLLAALLPLCAQAAQVEQAVPESRVTLELAEKILLECRRGDTFRVLQRYNFSRKEYEQMETYLHNWENYSMQDQEMLHVDESRFTLETIVKDILCKLTYDIIFECNFIELMEEESDLYYIVNTDKGKTLKILVPIGDVIFDPQLYSDILTKNSILKIYAVKTPYLIKAVKIMLLPQQNDSIVNVCRENYACLPKISESHIMELRRHLKELEQH